MNYLILQPYVVHVFLYTNMIFVIYDFYISQIIIDGSDQNIPNSVEQEANRNEYEYSTIKDIEKDAQAEEKFSNYVEV